MTSETVRFAKPLIVASLAMSASLVAIATQLDAPSITAVAPSLFAPSIAAHEAPQTSGVTSGAAVAAIDQAAPSNIKLDARSVDGAALIKRAKLNATKLAAANPVTVQPALASGSQAPASADIKPKRIHVVPPIYPDSALRAGIYGGIVDLSFTVAITGDVQNAEVIRSEPAGIFDEAALTSIRQWRFEPAVKDGQAMATQLKLRLRFSPGPGYPNSGEQPNDPAAAAPNEHGPTNLAVHPGEKLNLKFTDIDVREVLKVLADTSGQNILISDKVSGKITLQLANTPWDQALDLIVREKGLVKRQQGGVILIEPAPTSSAVL